MSFAGATSRARASRTMLASEMLRSPRSTLLTNFTVNPEPPLRDADYTRPSIDKAKWEFHEEPFSE